LIFILLEINEHHTEVAYKQANTNVLLEAIACHFEGVEKCLDEINTQKDIEAE